MRWQKAAWEADEEEEEKQRRHRRLEAKLERENIGLAEQTAINNMIKYHVELDRERRRASSVGAIFVTPPPSPVLGLTIPKKSRKGPKV